MAVGEQSTTIRFTFRKSNTQIDLTYMDNTAQYLNLCKDIASMGDIRAKSITFSSASSPEGTYQVNKSLAQARAASVIDMLRKSNPSVFSDNMVTNISYSNEGWDEVLSRLRKSNIQGRDEAISLISSYGGNIESELQSNELKEALKRIDRGNTWRKMDSEIFPYVRFGSVTIVFEPAHPVVQHDTVVIKSHPVVQHDTVVIKSETVVSAPTPTAVIDTAALAQIIHDLMKKDGWRPQDSLALLLQSNIKKTKVEKSKKDREPILAVKTNLLFDLASALNIEVEVPIENKYSILVEHTFPWWLPVFGDKHYSLELLRTGIEGRYWLGDRAKAPLLTGTFLGIYANADYFDIEWQDRGWQGETITDFGFTMGISKKIATNWRLELSGSLGYFYSKVTEYKHSNVLNMLIGQKDDSFTWIGPTKLKCSISWLLPNYSKKSKKGGTK